MTARAFIPTTRLREVLTTAPSIARAAELLGVGQDTLRSLAYRHHFGRLLNGCRLRGLAQSGVSTRGQYNFVDMTGQTLAGVEVLSRADNLTGNANWNCKHSCGHLARYEGIRIRATAKAGQALRCKLCAPKRPGTVRRVRGNAGARAEDHDG